MSDLHGTRRQLLAATATSIAAGLAGCNSGDESPFDEEAPELDDPILGDEGPLVEVYADFACPHCHTFEQDVRPELESMAEDGDLRLQPRDFPIPVDDPWSWRVPNLPRSAQAQLGSTDDYLAVERHVWENWNGGSFDEAYVRGVAEEFDLDADRTWQAVRHERYREDVESDRQRGIDAGVGGTPAVIVEGETLLQSPSLAEVQQAVEEVSG